ncbi:MAG: T9SS type A sorting domain-containing protein [Aureispira sp.]|nr:T9SS type A sorting domain-containing protein [Aureispira sp.]
MKKLKTLILSATVLGLPFIGGAQHQHTNQCGTTMADQAIIVDNLLRNRKNIKQADIDAMKNNRAVTYVPITPQNVGYQGADYAPVEDIYDMICDLNNNYADHDIQFFITDSIRFRSDYHLWDNPGSLSARIKMSGTYKIYNTINMYITKSVNGASSSWYDGGGDYLVIRQNMMAPGKSSTETHEVGHFFTLPHTFYGWEGNNPVSGNVPASINGWPVEKVTRGAGSNCNNSADYFCDTPADYESDRNNSCNYIPAYKDPTGATLDPDEKNIMSYFGDHCVDSFSNQQGTAIQADVVARSNQFSNNYSNWTQWLTNTPTSTTKVSETSVTSMIPANGSIFQLSGNTTKLDWNAVPGATMYIVELYPATGNGVFTFAGPIWSKVMRNVDEVNLANTYFTDLFYNYQWTRFAWRVRPMNDYWTCAGYTPYSYFELGTPTGTQDLEARRIMSVDVNPNPVVGNSTTVVVQSTEELEGSIQLYSIQGQLLAEQPSQLLTAGENRVEINLTNVSAGAYMVVVQTARGALHKKLIVQR